MELGAMILRVLIMVLNKVLLISMMIMRFGSEGCLGGSLIVKIMFAVRNSGGRVLDNARLRIEGVVWGSSTGVGGTFMFWRDAAAEADGPDTGAWWGVLGAKVTVALLAVPELGLPRKIVRLLRKGTSVKPSSSEGIGE